MKYRTLPGTDLNVSQVCLGTMTWGEQNSEAQAHEQLDYAAHRGINFIDTAEMYPVPPNGRTESYLVTWLAHRVLALALSSPPRLPAPAGAIGFAMAARISRQPSSPRRLTPVWHAYKPATSICIRSTGRNATCRISVPRNSIPPRRKAGPRFTNK